MSLDTATDADALVAERTSTAERVAAGLVGLAAVTMAAGVLGVTTVLPAGATVAGTSVANLLGVALTLLGLGVVGVGVASATSFLETRPDHTGGLLAATLYGLVWAATASVVAAQGLGLSTLWPVATVLVGGFAVALTLVVREDLATTVPAGAFLLLAGLVVLTGVIGPGWRWNPSGFSVTFTRAIAVPGLAVAGGLVGGWTAARAYTGFGAQGRQTGAYALVGTNAVFMVLLPLSIVAVIVLKGWAPMTQGVRFGLFWEPLTWFYVPVLEKYVIVHGPLVWFYWPFVMEAASLGPGADGILPAVVGTLWVVLGAVTFAVPLGLGAAVFLTEYAEQGPFTDVIEIATSALWSTPSIVYGLFGLAFLVPRFGNQSTILAGQLVLGFMLLPLVVITSREALKSVPDEYRDASAALGVTKWDTIKSVVLPAAMPGTVTGVILGVGRIAGETAPILLVMTSSPFPNRVPGVIQGAFAFTSQFPFVRTPTVDLLQSSSALPYQLFAVITAGVGQGDAFGWGTALVLLLLVMSLFGTGVLTRIYFRRKLTE